jgi:elongation factor G
VSMKQYPVDKLRNIALVGNSGAGKTSLVEAALFATKVTTRMGKPEDGNTIADFDPEEVRRGISLSTTVIPIEWHDHKLNFLDTPGYADFIGEVIAALRAVEAAVLVVDASSGVEVGTELAWQQLDELKMPRMVVINKMNREHANWTKVLADLEATFQRRFVPLQLPVGHALDFQGVYDLVADAAHLGPDGKPGQVPAEVKAAADDRREAMVEAAAEADDELILKFLEGEKLTADEVHRGLLAGAKAGSFVPVLFTAASEGIGIQALLSALVALLPSPRDGAVRTAVNQASGAEVALKPDPAAPVVVQVFKTLADPYVGKMQYVRLFAGDLDADSRLFNVNRREEERIGPVYVVRGKDQLIGGKIPVGDIGAVAKLQHTLTGDTLCDKTHPLQMPTFTYPQPLYAVALSPATQADSTKLGPALHRIVEEDPSLHSEVDGSTRELVLSGMGDAHVEVAVRRLADKFGVSVNTSIPKVPYRETITRTASTQYRHKKQTGGAGQFAEVHLRVEPRARGEGFVYASEVFGGHISQQFIPSIQKASTVCCPRVSSPAARW